MIQCRNSADLGRFLSLKLKCVDYNRRYKATVEVFQCVYVEIVERFSSLVVVVFSKVMVSTGCFYLDAKRVFVQYILSHLLIIRELHLNMYNLLNPRMKF